MKLKNDQDVDDFIEELAGDEETYEALLSQGQLSDEELEQVAALEKFLWPDRSTR